MAETRGGGLLAFLILAGCGSLEDSSENLRKGMGELRQGMQDFDPIAQQKIIAKLFELVESEKTMSAALREAKLQLEVLQSSVQYFRFEIDVANASVTMQLEDPKTREVLGDGQPFFRHSLEVQHPQPYVQDLSASQVRSLNLKGGKLYNCVVNVQPRDVREPWHVKVCVLEKVGAVDKPAQNHSYAWNDAHIEPGEGGQFRFSIAILDTPLTPAGG